jgi:hypothetical protein
MSDTSPVLSLADKARRLATLARVKREAETDSQDQVRFVNQLDKLTRELDKLRTALATHRRLESDGVVTNGLPDLVKEPRDLRDQVTRIGRPSAQYVSARVTSVGRAHVAITQADTTAWRAWAESCIGRLHLALIPRLGLERGAAENRVKQLRRLAGSAPSPGDMAEFRMLIARLEEDLARVERGGVDPVLARFVDRRILLADLGDDELALLRSDEALRDQLYVSLS